MIKKTINYTCALYHNAIILNPAYHLKDTRCISAFKSKLTFCWLIMVLLLAEPYSVILFYWVSTMFVFRFICSLSLQLNVLLWCMHIYQESSSLHGYEGAYKYLILPVPVVILCLPYVTLSTCMYVYLHFARRQNKFPYRSI